MGKARNLANLSPSSAGLIGAEDLESTLNLTGKTVTLPAGAGGKVLQVVQAVKTDTFSATGTSSNGNIVWFDITGITVSITPSSASSRILIMTQISTASNNSSGMRLVRNSTPLNVGDGAGSRAQTTSGQWYTSNTYNVLPFTLLYVDSPATTSATTYKVQAYSAPGIFRVNFSNQDTDNFEWTRSASSIVAMEIAG